MLPKHGDQNWGATLNEFLLTAHRDNGRLRQHMDVANVQDFGAGTGDPAIDSPAIQAAIDSGMHVYFPDGVYVYDQLTFGQNYQQVTCAPNAILQPAYAASVITITGYEMRFNNFRVETSGPDQIERLIALKGARGCHFDRLNILAPHAKEGVYLEKLVKCVFMGGDIKGNNSAEKIAGSAGLRLGADKSVALNDYTNTNAGELRAFGLSIHHWDTGVLFSGTAHDDPTFCGCNIENNLSAAIRFEPEFHPDQQGDPQAVFYNLNLIGCHFEGSKYNIQLNRQAVIKGADISGCRFGSKTKRVIKAEGVLLGVRMMGCYLSATHLDDDMLDELNQNGTDRCTDDPNLKPRLAHIWDVERLGRNCVDLFNHWEDLPDCNFVLGNQGDRVVRMNAESGNGKALDIHSSLRHGGDELAFFGSTPTTQPAGYIDLDGRVEDLDHVKETLSQTTSQLNKLTSDLASLGLINKAMAN